MLVTDWLKTIRRRVGGHSPRVGLSHINTVSCCFVLCLDVFTCYLLSALMYLDRSTYDLCLLYVRMLDLIYMAILSALSARYDLFTYAKCLNKLDYCGCCKALFYQQSGY